MMKYSFKKFFGALILGKVMLGLLVAYAGRYSFTFLTFLLGEGNILVSVLASVIFMALMIIIILKIDWIEAAEYIDKHGPISYIRLLARRLLGRTN